MSVNRWRSFSNRTGKCVFMLIFRIIICSFGLKVANDRYFTLAAEETLLCDNLYEMGTY